MAGGVTALAEMRAKGMTMLKVACNRRERRGRLRIERLIAEHVPTICRRCASSSPATARMRSPRRFYDKCRVHFPQLPGLFM
jgi:hypothetical protein